MWKSLTRLAFLGSLLLPTLVGEDAYDRQVRALYASYPTHAPTPRANDSWGPFVACVLLLLLIPCVVAVIHRYRLRSRARSLIGHMVSRGPGYLRGYNGLRVAWIAAWVVVRIVHMATSYDGDFWPGSFGAWSLLWAPLLLSYLAEIRALLMARPMVAAQKDAEQR